MIVLIDSEASHNFICRDIIEKLSLLVMQTKPFRVRVGDEYKVQSEGKCKGVCLEIQGIIIVQNFFPFDIRSVDVILGIAWQETLVKTMTDWNKHIMKFRLG